VLAFLGTASLGGVARFDPPASIDARAVVAPVEGIDAFELPPGGTHVAYGDPPDDPDVAHFERDVWSENPTLAPADVAADDPVLATGDLSDAIEECVQSLGLLVRLVQKELELGNFSDIVADSRGQLATDLGG